MSGSKRGKAVCFLAQNPSPMLRVDLKGTLVHANDAARNLLGESDRGAAKVTQDVLGSTITSALDAEAVVTVEIELKRKIFVFCVVPLIEHGCVDLYGTDITGLHTEQEQYRARLRSLADRLSTAEEGGRRRISSYLHDSVIQTLSLSNIRLAALRDSIRTACLTEQYELVDGIRALVEKGIRECRELIENLTPRRLYEMGLKAALRDVAEELKDLHGVPVVIDDVGFLDPVGNSLRSLLFQAARELISNSLKHAEASEIRVTLSMDDGDARIRVQDDGNGFDVKTVETGKCSRPGGFGLFNVRERAESLGGWLEIKSVFGKGTSATVIVPVAGIEERTDSRGSAVREVYEMNLVRRRNGISDRRIRLLNRREGAKDRRRFGITGSWDDPERRVGVSDRRRGSVDRRRGLRDRRCSCNDRRRGSEVRRQGSTDRRDEIA